MAESAVESYLRKKVIEAGGVCWKWTSPGRRGVPDRVVILPGNVVAFVETKDLGKKERASQVRVQGILRMLDCRVYSSVDSKVKVNAVVRELQEMSRRRVGEEDGV